MDLPSEAIEYVRTVFAKANHGASSTLSLNPNCWEEMLDFQVISALAQSSAPVRLGNDLFVRIQTHFLGGRHLYGTWEIADIGVLIHYRVRGKLIRTKLALLQSKRLYAKEAKGVEEAEAHHYEIGFARLHQEDEDYDADLAQRTFTFDRDCRYRAMKKGDVQEKAIREYEKERELPVHYLFYNPLVVPSALTVPATPTNALPANETGTRVFDSAAVRLAESGLKKGESLTYGALTDLDAANAGSVNHRLEDFIADRLLGCHEGFSTDDPEDFSLEAVFFRRSGPISAAIAVTVDLPDGD